MTKFKDSEMELPGACEKWSVKDMLSHLVDWEQRCLGWYKAGVRGEVPKTPDENYNWCQLQALNQVIYLKYKGLSLEEVLERYRTSFEDMMKVVGNMSEEELFEPKYYRWTGNGMLRDIIDANTASHYRWAVRLIRKFRKSLTDQNY